MKLKIVGPPGTGKTTRLMELLEEEIGMGTSSKKIAFLTFTKAAREVALNRTGKTEVDFPYLRTIHAICYRQMNISQEQIVKPTNLRSFGGVISVKLNGNNVDPWVEEFERGFESPTRDDLLLQINHLGRHRGILLKEALQGATLDIDYKYAKWFTKAYSAWKQAEGLLDYTDLLTKYIDEGKPLDIDAIFIDEAQDLSLLQWEVVTKLGANAQRYYIAGDDDQAIFNWAGADSEVFQTLKTDLVEVLGESKRVSKAVHAAAQKIAGRIKTRIPKEYQPTEYEGKVAQTGYLSSLKFDQKTFVLFRNHYRVPELVRQLKNMDVPFIGPGSPLNSNDVRIAMQAWWVILKKGEIPSAAAKKMIRYCDKEYIKLDIKKKLTAKTYVTKDEVFERIPDIRQWARVMFKLPGLNVLEHYVRRAGYLSTANPKVELLSIHQSKGREAEMVVIDTEISRNVYESLLANPDDEHRVWYVAVTRSKKDVYFLMPDGPYSYKI